MAYIYNEERIMGILSGLFAGIPFLLLSIASYVLTSAGLYTIARRRGLNHPWIAWIPVVSCWILGSLSDQYHYVVKGKNKAKRKFLLVLNILTLILSVMIFALMAAFLFHVISGVAGRYRDSELMDIAMGPIVGVLGLSLPLCGMAIALVIIRYMALYDVYRSLDPGNCVLYLVLSILIGITQPFFLFFNRNKDLGMPPRRDAAGSPLSPHPGAQDSWNPGEKDDL